MTKDLTAKDFATLEKSIANLIKKQDAIVDKLMAEINEQAAVICNIHKDLEHTTEIKNKVIKENETLRAKVNQLEDEIDDLLSHLR